MRAFLDVVAITAPLAFLLLIVYPGFEFAYEETYITTPALEIPERLAGRRDPVGTVLMIVMAVLKLAQVGSWRLVIGALVPVIAIGALLLALAPVLRPLGNYNLLIFFVGLVAAMVFAGVPIAFPSDWRPSPISRPPPTCP